MDERITEAELRDIEVKSARFRDGTGGEIVTLFAGCCEDLAKEVRRLRGLIAAAYDSHDVNLTLLLNLLTEAEAIREEQASLDKRA